MYVCMYSKNIQDIQNIDPFMYEYFNVYIFFLSNHYQGDFST